MSSNHLCVIIILLVINLEQTWLFRITENEPSNMHNVRPYVYSRHEQVIRTHVMT